MKHFVIHTQYYPPEMGAPQARLSELAAGLSAKGYHVSVLTAMPNYPTGKIFPGYTGFYHREKQGLINVIRCCIYPSKSTKLLPRLINYLSFVVSSFFIGLFTLNNISFFMTESPPLFLGMSGYLLSRLKQARWIFNVSDLWPESAVHLGVISEGLALKLSYRLEEFCYRKAWLVTGQSKSIILNIHSRFPEVRGYNLSNGVDLEKFKVSFKQNTRPIGWGDKTILIYAGLHGIAQGLELILDAAKRVEQFDDTLFLFVGDGPEKNKLKRLAVKKNLSNVTFLDPMPKDQIIPMITNADICLVPLKVNLPGAVPSKLYEAMASSNPVIMVAEGEAAEIVMESNAGVVVKPNDLESLVTAIIRLKNDREQCQILGNNGRKAVEEYYNRAKIIENFVELISLY